MLVFVMCSFFSSLSSLILETQDVIISFCTLQPTNKEIVFISFNIHTLNAYIVGGGVSINGGKKSEG